MNRRKKVEDNIKNLEKILGMTFNKFMAIHYDKENKSLETISLYIEKEYGESKSPSTLALYSKIRGVVLKKPSSYIGNH
jgi:hypothetical protein